jgi:pimeloyl-ACP methyl ester carboxylesterase
VVDAAMGSLTLPCRFLEAGDARLCYRDDGSGPALVLVHGWLLDSTIWTAQVKAWSPRFRVLRLDRRGFGQSSGAPDLAADARDVVRLLDRLGIERAAILGMSQGARIALHIADTAPQRVACLVLDGTPAITGLPGDWPSETPVAHYRKLLLEQGIDALCDELATHPLMQLRTRDPAARAMLDAMLARYTGADLLAAPTASIDVPPGRLAQLPPPVLLLNGALDTPVRLQVAEVLARLLPTSNRQVLPSAGHLACLDARETYSAVVLEFLNRNLHRWA